MLGKVSSPPRPLNLKQNSYFKSLNKTFNSNCTFLQYTIVYKDENED